MHWLKYSGGTSGDGVAFRQSSNYEVPVYPITTRTRLLGAELRMVSALTTRTESNFRTGRRAEPTAKRQGHSRAFRTFPESLDCFYLLASFDLAFYGFEWHESDHITNQEKRKGISPCV